MPIEHRKFFNSRRLAILILLGSLGGLASVLVGHLGSLLSAIPFGSFVNGQLLSGLHVFWLILAGALVRSRGAATFVGALKGSVEMLLPNHLGPFVFLLSLVEGLTVELVLLPFGKTRSFPVYLAAGFSSTSNVMVLQLFLLPNLSPGVLLSMYFASFASGIVFAGYLGLKSLGILEKQMQT